MSMKADRGLIFAAVVLATSTFILSNTLVRPEQIEIRIEGKLVTFSKISENIYG